MCKIVFKLGVPPKLIPTFHNYILTKASQRLQTCKPNQLVEMLPPDFLIGTFCHR